ncbi:hypothetical protein GCK32_008971 [Trichostrongylus colubriformis]|uniref:Uncharacterized protein n=1 Tax=Trichostrongylus colubriformis TaxID=6319 RepID=A0AAN8IWT7_TRICO
MKDVDVNKGTAPPTWDIAMTFRSYACSYMILLAMYFNTLLLVALNYTLPFHGSRGGKRDKRTILRPDVGGRKEPKGAPPSEDMETFMKYDEQRTQEQKDHEGDYESNEEKIPGRTKHDKTLKSARMSIRLPRAPKGHHVEELDQMEKFLAEDDGG